MMSEVKTAVTPVLVSSGHCGNTAKTVLEPPAIKDSWEFIDPEA